MTPTRAGVPSTRSRCAGTRATPAAPAGLATSSPMAATAKASNHELGEGPHPSPRRRGLWWQYLLHFDRPYQHAKHYLGSCQDLERRLTHVAKASGARLLEVVQAVGIGWQLARTWCGGKQRERQLKKQGGASRCCPICKEARRAAHHLNIATPVLGAVGRPPAALRHGLQKRGARRHAAPATPEALTLTCGDARGAGQYPSCPPY